MLYDQTFMLDILNEARSIAEFTKGLTYAEFIQDLRTRKAVERSFEIIGEASKSLSKEFRAEHSELPWRWMIDTRNIIIHEYRKVNYAVLWETIQEDIPQIICILGPLIPPEGESLK